MRHRPAGSVDREFWRARQAQPRAITFISFGQNRAVIAPPDATPDEIIAAWHQAAVRAMQGVPR